MLNGKIWIFLQAFNQTLKYEIMEASDIFMILLSTLQQLFTHSKTASYCAQMADHILDLNNEIPLIRHFYSKVTI